MMKEDRKYIGGAHGQSRGGTKKVFMLEEEMSSDSFKLQEVRGLLWE